MFSKKNLHGLEFIVLCSDGKMHTNVTIERFQNDFQRCLCGLLSMAADNKWAVYCCQDHRLFLLNLSRP